VAQRLQALRRNGTGVSVKCGAQAQGSAPTPTDQSLLLSFTPGFLLLEDSCSHAFPRTSCPEILVGAVFETDTNIEICIGSVKSY